MLAPHADRSRGTRLHSLADVVERGRRRSTRSPRGSAPSRSCARSTTTASVRGTRSTAAGRASSGRPRPDPVPSLAVPSRHPNDVAPSGYNDPPCPTARDTSPMDPVPSRTGFGRGRGGRIGLPMADESFAHAQRTDRERVRGSPARYIGAAVYYEAETLGRLAQFFYRQAVEERTHAMMMVQYLIDVDEEVRIPDIAGPDPVRDPVAPVRMAPRAESSAWARRSTTCSSWRPAGRRVSAVPGDKRSRRSR